MIEEKIAYISAKTVNGLDPYIPYIIFSLILSFERKYFPVCNIALHYEISIP